MRLISEVANHWWAFALRGVVAVVFGVLAFVWPGLTLAVLVILWGTFAFMDGVLALLSALRATSDHRWGLVLEGIVGIGAGIVTWNWPGLTALVLLYIIAVWALLTGVLELLAAFRLRKVIDNEWWLALSGIASLVFGVILLVAPGAGAIAVVWLIAAYSIVFGAFMLALAWELYRVHQRRRQAPAAA